MEKDVLPKDFKEFLKLLNEADAQYLLIGGYAVGYCGYPRSTAHMDIWIAISPNYEWAFHQFVLKFLQKQRPVVHRSFS